MRRKRIDAPLTVQMVSGADDARARMIQRQKDNHKTVSGGIAQIERVEAEQFAQMGEKAKFYKQGR